MNKETRSHRLLSPFVPLCLGVSLLSAAEPETLAPTIIQVDEQKHKAALTPTGWVGGRLWHAMRGFHEGLCPVQAEENGKWGAIDMTGNLVVPLEYESVLHCYNGLIPVQKGKAWGYLKADGSVALPFTDEWEDTGLFNGHHLAPVKKGGLWGYIRPDGSQAIPPQFEEARPFPSSGSPARVKKGGKWGFIDPTGKEVIPCQYEAVRAFTDKGEVAWFQKEKDGPWGLLGSTGREILPPTYAEATDFRDNISLAAVRKEKAGRWGFINPNGEMVIDLQFADARTFSPEGFAIVKANKPNGTSQWVIIDQAGNVILSRDEDYVHAWSVARGLAVLRYEEGAYRLANLDGTLAEPTTWKNIFHQAGSHTVLQAPSEAVRGMYAVRSPEGQLSPWFTAPAPEVRATSPVLRIEAGMHTSMVNSISTDASGSMVLTLSNDKTAKLWKLDRASSPPSATLLRTLRPFLAEGREGRLDAGALSPDGKWAVLGGRTQGETASGEHHLYLFDTATGALLRRWPAGDGVIFRTAFSPSGQRLAVVSGAGELRVFDPVTATRLGAADDGQGRSDGLDWLGEDRLVTTSKDGKLRLYRLDAQGLKLVHTHATTAGKQPHSVRVSPDGNRLAVAYEDSKIVTLHAATDLSLIKKLETTSGSEHGFFSTCWLSDGGLATAGMWQKQINQQWCFPIRVWPASALKPGKSNSQPMDLPAAQDTVFDLQPLPGGGLLFAAATPEWGVALPNRSGSLKPITLGAPPIAQFNGGDFDVNGFRLSPDGRELAFEYGSGLSPATFSIPQQKLTVLKDAAAVPDTLRRPRQSSDRLKITDWNGTQAPKLLGRPLALKATERALSLCIAADDSRFVLGCDWSLRAFSAGGTETWSTSATSSVWAVNLTQDGKVAVAAYADGTIRWHDMVDGRELLAFFPHADQQRWVMWVPTAAREKRWQGTPKLAGAYVSQGGEPGIKVTSPSPDMAAQGIEFRDVITEVNGKKVDRVMDLEVVLKDVRDSGDVSVTWLHKGETKQGRLPLTGDYQFGEWKSSGAYFTCSAGAENLIGWHVNRGADRAAEFYPCEQLYANFYRPDIVLEVLKQRRGAEEIAKEMGITFNLEAALKKVPVVKLQGVRDGETMGTDTAVIQLEAWDTGGGVKDISLFHNGKRIPQDGPGQRRGEVRTLSYTVMLQPGENELKAQAANDAGTISNPAIARVKFNGVQATSTLHLLTIGLNRYQNPKYNLTYCVPDADACAEAFAKRAPGLFAEVKTYALRDADATKPKIAETFAQIAKAAKPSDVFIFCYAGHGVMGEKPEGKPGDNEFYLLPHDVIRMYGDPALLAEKGVSKADLETWCTNIPARKQVMLLDTCQSGGLVDTFAMRGVAEEKAIAMLARASGTMVIASTGAEAYARESKDIGHGIFTKALLDGLLETKADADKDGKITVKEMDTYIGQAVPELSQKLTNTPQFPTSYARGQDFPIGVVK